MEKKDDSQENSPQPGSEGYESIGRVRTPRGNEVLGIVESRLGFGKMNVLCSDKKVRNCRVPGKYRRKIWVKEGDVVLVQPWQFEGDKKGDIIFKYRKMQAFWLKEKGYLKDLDVV